MAGPATNVATIGAVYRALGARSLVVYLTTIVVGSMAAALLFDSLVSSGASGVGHAHEHTTWWAVVSAVVLLAMMGWFAMDELRSSMASSTSGSADGDSMVVGVDGMTCPMCVKHVTKALEETEGVEEVEVTLEPGRAQVRGHATADAVRRGDRGCGVFGGGILTCGRVDRVRVELSSGAELVSRRRGLQVDAVARWTSGVVAGFRSAGLRRFWPRGLLHSFVGELLDRCFASPRGRGDARLLNCV